MNSAHLTVTMVFYLMNFGFVKSMNNESRTSSELTIMGISSFTPKGLNVNLPQLIPLAIKTVADVDNILDGYNLQWNIDYITEVDL